MNVLYLTIFVSVVLVAIFVAGFLYHSLGASGDPLRDSLLPFRKDGRRDPDAVSQPSDRQKPL